jgi:integrase
LDVPVSGDYAALLKLLLLTGARRDEIARLRWSEIDLEAALVRLPGERTKNGRPHDIPLSPQALAILKARPRQDGRDFVLGTNGHGFVDFSGARADLDQRLDGAIAERWTLHDLRRTLSTRLHGAPFSVLPHVCEALLAHTNGNKMAATYNKQDYLLERRAALAMWGEHIARIAGGADPAEHVVLDGRASNVVALHSA